MTGSGARRRGRSRRSMTSARPVAGRFRRSSVDEGAPGASQEGVLEGRATDEHGAPREAALVGRGDRGLTVIGVQEDAVGQSLDTLREPVELAVERLLDPGREAELRGLTG